MVLWAVLLLTPLAAVSVASWVLASRRPSSGAVIPALITTSVTAWLLYVGLFQHETPCGERTTACPTVYGYDAPLTDEHPLGLVVIVAGFLLPAAWVGWHRLALPFATGFSLTVGPLLLAGWTAPRGDNDGLWVLIFFGLPVLGGIAALVTAVAGLAAAARTRRGDDSGEMVVATPSDRLAALVVDAVVCGGALAVPLTLLSNGGREVEAVLVGVVAAMLYLAIPLARRGRTFGQSLLGLMVLDHDSGRPVSFVRAAVRSVVVVLEVLGLPSMILAAPAGLEFLSAARTGRSLTDRALRTVVMSQRGA